MRRELLYTPHLLAGRITEGLTRRHRLRSLRGTAAHELEADHIETLELIQRVQATEAPRVVYDIGGNRGTWTVLARTICPAAEVHAFEPLEEVREEFLCRTAPVGRTTLHTIALGAVTGTERMNVHVFADSSSLLPLSEADAVGSPDHLKEVRRVSVVALDEYVAERGLPEPDLIKIDVQGYEVEVFRGAPRALAHARAIIAEVSFSEIYVGQPLFGEVACFLGSIGYRVAGFSHGFPPAHGDLRQADVLFLRT